MTDTAAKLIPRPLLLTSNDGTQTGRSGYDVLADYLAQEGADVLRWPRRDPKRFMERLVRRLLIQRSASKSFVVSSWKLERLARRAMRVQPPSLVHYLWGDRDWGYLHQYTRQKKIPLILTMHACPDDLENIFPAISMMKDVDAFILMSSNQKPFFLSSGVPEEKLHVILHGIDTEHFQPSVKRREWSGKPFQILSVGQTRRNFVLLQKLIKVMEDDEVEFRIISKPSFSAHFKNLKRVKFESGLSDEELLLAYQESDALIMTADEATANNAVLEAMACGLPVVTEAVGGLVEYVGTSGGIVVERNSESELREALLSLKTNSTVWQKASANARARAHELDWRFSVREIQKLYAFLTN